MTGMGLRAMLLKVHLWVGMVAALFLFALGLSGALLTFEDIIDPALNASAWYVKPQGTPLKLTQITQAIRQAFPQSTLEELVLPQKPDDTVKIVALQSNGDESARKRYSGMAALTKWSFNRLLWNEKGGYLYDVVNGGPSDASIRPNQIFAVSLPHSMLSADRAKQVVSVVEQHLLTPYGLRSLAPSDPQYRGRYTGDGASRDGAYHQGTVWPWLMGPFITAYIKINGGSEAARRQAELWLTPLKEHLSDAGLGHISEIFEGDAPHGPVGCIAQAWSVAEILRATVEDIYEIRPRATHATLKAVSNRPSEAQRKRAAS